MEDILWGCGLTSKNFFRPTWAEIDVDAFRHNLKVIASNIRRGTKIMAVLKADGYGHGAAPLARAAVSLKNIPLWGFGVSSVEEGLSLRAAGFRRKILVLGSLFPFASFEAALKNDLTPTIASRSAVKALAHAAARLRRKSAFHIKVDTGMGRIGVTPATAVQILENLPVDSPARLEGVYTHLAQAGSREAVETQMKLFEPVVKTARRRFPEISVHAANSEGTLRFPKTHLDIVRPGIALYGADPRLGVKNFPLLSGEGSGRAGARGNDLKPVLHWKTRIVFLKTVPRGTSVSYGGDFTTRRRSRLATLPVGYADGYRRAFSNKAHVLIRGRRCPVVGRVTMDQIVVDVTDVPGLDVGEEVVLLGAQGRERISAEELASWAETISYEILCGITPRVPRAYK